MQPPPMRTGAIHELLSGLRCMGPPLLDRAEDPHAELMALVWGHRFDREHAQALLGGASAGAPEFWPRMARAADCFDGLPSHRQDRLRRLILRHGRLGRGPAAGA